MASHLRHITAVSFVLLLGAQQANVRAQLAPPAKEIPLYEGDAPGSEHWTWTEITAGAPSKPIVQNVVHPELMYYPADKSSAVGTAMIVAPGGGFRQLMMSYEGVDIARRLNEMGVDAFVLKYRLRYTDPHARPATTQASASTRATVSTTEQTGPQAGQDLHALAGADGQRAIRLLRDHAADYGFAPDRIGIIGFSAGGVISVATAYNATPENRPDFIGFVYGGMTPATFQAPVPADAPPLFIAAASDDQYDLQLVAVKVYTKWVAAKRVAEMHIYAKGGHGFGLRKQQLPSDSWTDRFLEFLTQQGLLKN